jgi:hypothetical protein
VNRNQELCIELWSVINFHCEIEPANLLQYIRFPLALRAINLCAALKIWKFSVMALDEVKVGHPCCRSYALQHTKTAYMQARKPQLLMTYVETIAAVGIVNMRQGLIHVYCPLHCLAVGVALSHACSLPAGPDDAVPHCMAGVRKHNGHKRKCAPCSVGIHTTVSKHKISAPRSANSSHITTSLYACR